MISSSNGSCGNDRNRSQSHISAISMAAARGAGDGADDDPDNDGDQHGCNADRHRDAAAVDHTGEKILAEIIGAERMR